MPAARKEVVELFRLGPLPGASTSKETITQFKLLLQRIKRPLTDEEAY